MRKNVLAAVLAALTLLLSGCGSLLERDYSVVRPHSSTYYESEDRSVLRAESYQDLVNDLLLLLTGGAKEGTVWLYAGSEPMDASAARSGSGELVVQVGYFDHQEEQVRAIVDQVQAMEAPEEKEPWTVNFYPEGGDVGIIEIILKKS